jgi:hypothetical protein
MINVRRTLAASALAPLLAAGLVACGGDSGSGSGADSASEPTSQAANVSAGLQEGDEVDPGEFVQTVTDGLEASTTAHLSMSLTMGSAGEMKAEGDVDYTTTPPQMAMTMSSPMLGDDMEIRMVDGVMYISMGQLTQGKFWKLDPSDPKGPLAGMEGMLDQLDPAKAMKSMEDGISSVVFAGEEDGLDHYELTVDMNKMLDSMGGDLPKGAAAQLPESVTYDLWLDDQGRFTKMVMDQLPMGGTSGSMEMNVTGWGEDATIEAPPADQVTKMPDMGQVMQGMSGASA